MNPTELKNVTDGALTLSKITDGFKKNVCETLSRKPEKKRALLQDKSTREALLICGIGSVKKAPPLLIPKKSRTHTDEFVLMAIDVMIREAETMATALPKAFSKKQLADMIPEHGRAIHFHDAFKALGAPSFAKLCLAK